MGFGLVSVFIESLEFITISNYSDITNLHTLQFTKAHIKSYQSAVSVPLSSLSMFTNCCLKTQTLNELIVATDPHYIASAQTAQKTLFLCLCLLLFNGPHRKFHYSVVVCRPLSNTPLVSLLVSWPLPI
jgi:hypothetical protein